MIDKEFVPYQEALALKELGYRDPCFGTWLFNPSIDKPNEEQLQIIESHYFGLPEYGILAPTFSQAFRWFRDKYQIDSWIFPNLNSLYSVSIIRRGVGVGKISEYQIYEEAELACLKRLIEIVKEKNK